MACVATASPRREGDAAENAASREAEVETRAPATPPEDAGREEGARATRLASRGDARGRAGAAWARIAACGDDIARLRGKPPATLVGHGARVRTCDAVCAAYRQPRCECVDTGHVEERAALLKRYVCKPVINVCLHVCLVC